MMTFNRSMTQNIAIGTPVFTRDNEKLGEVKEFRGDAFKVSAEMAPDYWLPTACLTASSAAGTVVVDATQDRIGDLKIDEPRSR
jgi:hypothetical protein